MEPAIEAAEPGPMLGSVVGESGLWIAALFPAR